MGEGKQGAASRLGGGVMRSSVAEGVGSAEAPTASDESGADQSDT